MGKDVFHLFNKEYLIVVDYTTNYFDISFPPDTESETVVQHTKSIFAKYCIPKETFSDNGPEFSSRTYKQFCKEWDISHDRSSPEHSNSNGLVERTIRTVKRTLRKAKRSNNDVHLSLLALKSSPGVKNQPSPACMFFNRNIRTVVPSVTENTGLKKNNFKLPKSSPGRDLVPLKSGDSVCFRGKGDKIWSRKGSVLEKLTQPRSYKVLTDKGTVLRRDRKSLLRTNEYMDGAESEYSDYSYTYRIPHPQLPEGQVHAEDNPGQVILIEAQGQHAQNERDHEQVRSEYATRSGRPVRPSSRFNDNEMT